MVGEKKLLLPLRIGREERVSELFRRRQVLAESLHDDVPLSHDFDCSLVKL